MASPHIKVDINITIDPSLRPVFERLFLEPLTEPASDETTILPIHAPRPDVIPLMSGPNNLYLNDEDGEMRWAEERHGIPRTWRMVYVERYAR